MDAPPREERWRKLTEVGRKIVNGGESEVGDADRGVRVEDEVSGGTARVRAAAGRCERGRSVELVRGRREAARRPTPRRRPSRPRTDQHAFRPRHGPQSQSSCMTGARVSPIVHRGPTSTKASISPLPVTPRPIMRRGHFTAIVHRGLVGPSHDAERPCPSHRPPRPPRRRTDQQAHR